jgi:hypothetical protein
VRAVGVLRLGDHFAHRRTHQGRRRARRRTLGHPRGGGSSVVLGIEQQQRVPAVRAERSCPIAALEPRQHDNRRIARHDCPILKALPTRHVFVRPVWADQSLMVATWNDGRSRCSAPVELRDLRRDNAVDQRGLLAANQIRVHSQEPFRGRRTDCGSVVLSSDGRARPAIAGVRGGTEVRRPASRLPNVRRWTAAKSVDSNTT